jgi:hypothetical protein
MKKRKNLPAPSPLQIGRANKIDCIPIQNPVAKFAHQFNKAHVFEDKNKYRRNAKHRKQEASPIALARVIGEASCFLDISIRNLEIGNSLKLNASVRIKK